MNTVQTRREAAEKASGTILDVVHESTHARRIAELTRGLAASRDIIAGLYAMLSDEQQKKVNMCGVFRAELRALREAMAWV